MAEVWFYHLERRGVDGERMAVVTTAQERLAELSQKIWAHDDTAFIPHGCDGDPDAMCDKIRLTASPHNTGNSTFCFYVDGASPDTLDGIERAVIMFDGTDDEAVQAARGQWKALKPAASAIKYWKQDDSGRWLDQASGS
jgi:DNA polymerase III subunit chi